MSVLDLLNATFNPKYLNTMNYTKSLSETNGAKTQSAKNNGSIFNAQNPSFGIKGRAPLNADTFQRSEEQQVPYFEYKGQKLAKKDAQQKSFIDTYKHEAAHRAKAGKHATTGICIDYDSNGIAIGGHVGIAMPKLNKANPKETIEHAEAVIASAEAPASFDELSDADKGVAASARSVLAQARSFESKNQGINDRKPLNLIA